MTMRPAVFLVLLLCLLLPERGVAEPPDWAPAHGWRKKQERDWQGHGHDQRSRQRHHGDWEKDEWDEDVYRHRRYSEHDRARWPSDYGVIHGECDREAIGAVLGGVVGGVIGSRTSSPENRKVAILLGGVVGAVIGAEIGRRMDERDRACIGHALELSRDGRPVTWHNDRTQWRYVLTPLDVHARDGQSCREFDLRVEVPGEPVDVSRHQACRRGDGRWQISG